MPPLIFFLFFCILAIVPAVLLARRPAGKVYAGYWEFPGGKFEPGEPAVGALARELHEELGIDVRRAYPWLTRVFAYPHATVRLMCRERPCTGKSSAAG